MAAWQSTYHRRCLGASSVVLLVALSVQNIDLEGVPVKVTGVIETAISVLLLPAGHQKEGRRTKTSSNQKVLRLLYSSKL